MRFRPRAQGSAFKTPLLLVPSLINRHYVLDLMPGKSFAEYFVAQGHDVWCIDWGTPGDEDRYVTFDDVCDQIIGRVRKTGAIDNGQRAGRKLPDSPACGNRGDLRTTGDWLIPVAGRLRLDESRACRKEGMEPLDLGLKLLGPAGV